MDACSSSSGDTPTDDLLGLRIVSIFVILAASSFGSFFPIVTHRWSQNGRRFRIPPAVFDFAKYFGSGVILATAFIHLLAPAFDELGDPCLADIWQQYDWAPAFAMIAVLALFFVELFAFRIGQAHLAQAGGGYDAHGHGVGEHATHNAHGPEPSGDEIHKQTEEAGSDSEVAQKSLNSGDARAKLIGVAILEFGVIFHSVLVGLTLAVDSAFKPLFVVLVFHQLFEGLGLGARLASLELPRAYSWAPYTAALAFGVTTPIGIAAGLGVRTTYSPDSTTANLVSGVFDSISAGILLYTALVELMAHEFLFNPQLSRMSNKRLLYACSCMLLGAGLMALLGRWA